MSDSEDDNGAFYSELISLRKKSLNKNNSKALSTDAARPRQRSEFLLNSNDVEPKPNRTLSGTSSEKTPNLVVLPSVDDVMTSTETTLLENYEKRQQDKNRSQKDKGLDPLKSEKVEVNSMTPTLFNLPDITWHVPMTSFEFLKTEKERLDRESRSKAMKRERMEKSHIRGAGVVKAKKKV